MRNYILPFVAVAIMLCTSCVKDEDEIINDQTKLETRDSRGYLVFYSASGRSSKVGMIDRKQQAFHADDDFSIFESTGATSQYVVDATGSVAVDGRSDMYSQAKLVYSSGDILTEGVTHYAVSPSGVWNSDGTITVTEATEQYATVGSHDNKASILYGTSSTNSIAFSNYSTLFRLVVYDNTELCDEIRLVGDGIAGDAVITISDGTISSGSADAISFHDASNGGIFVDDTTYYLAFLPGTYTELTATMYKDGSPIAGCEAASYKDKEWKRSGIYNLYLSGKKLMKKRPTVLDSIDGCLTGLFSVSETKQVRFSRGNLQYTYSGTHATNDSVTPGTWSFAAHQWDYVGSPANPGGNYNTAPNGTVSGSDNKFIIEIPSSYSGTIDLFGWATSGWNSGATQYLPYATATSAASYYPGGSSANSITGTYANADWGVYNAISNGGNAPRKWRTLTSAEAQYLMEDRTGAKNKCGLATLTDQGVQGLVLLPDTWSSPISFKSGSSSGYTTNQYTDAQWEKMEDAGAVFLPAAGYRNGSTVYTAGASGYYFTATAGSSGMVQSTYFFSNSTTSSICGYSAITRVYAQAVRLVR